MPPHLVTLEYAIHRRRACARNVIPIVAKKWNYVSPTIARRRSAARRAPLPSPPRRWQTALAAHAR
jgi:hypothetical protein